jgi:hypothetical protein
MVLRKIVLRKCADRSQHSLIAPELLVIIFIKGSYVQEVFSNSILHFFYMNITKGFSMGEGPSTIRSRKNSSRSLLSLFEVC